MLIMLKSLFSNAGYHIFRVSSFSQTWVAKLSFSVIVEMIK